MVFNVHRNSLRLIRDGERGGGMELEGGGGAILCHHQNDSCIKMVAMRAILMCH